MLPRLYVGLLLEQRAELRAETCERQHSCGYLGSSCAAVCMLLYAFYGLCFCRGLAQKLSDASVFAIMLWSVCVGDGECGRCAELQHLCVSESSTLCSVAVPGDQESEFAAGSELDGCRAQASLCVKYLDLRHNNAGCGTDVAFILDVNREIMSSACGPKSAFAIANSL